MYTPPSAPPYDPDLQPRRFRMSLGELAVIIVICGIVSAILFPVLAGRHERTRPNSCASHIKQIGLALIGYTQDYDGKFAPAASPVRLSDGRTVLRQWGLDTRVDTARGPLVIRGSVDDYLKNQQVLTCPSIKKSVSGVTYMFNDLAATHAQAEFGSVAETVLAVDGDDTTQNFGHAHAMDGEAPVAGTALPSVRSDRLHLLGGTVSTAALTRHDGGANYLLADGHVKWLLPDTVFFPPRFASTGGPAPGGPLVFQGRTYAATFRIR